MTQPRSPAAPAPPRSNARPAGDFGNVVRDVLESFDRRGYELAWMRLQDARGMQSDDPRVLLLLGCVELHRLRHREAGEALARARTLVEGNPAAVAALAGTGFARIREAVSLLHTAVEAGQMPRLRVPIATFLKEPVPDSIERLAQGGGSAFGGGLSGGGIGSAIGSGLGSGFTGGVGSTPVGGGTFPPLGSGLSALSPLGSTPSGIGFSRADVPILRPPESSGGPQTSGIASIAPAPAMSAGPSVSAGPATSSGPSVSIGPSVSMGPATSIGPMMSAGPAIAPAPSPSLGPATSAAPTISLSLEPVAPPPTFSGTGSSPAPIISPPPTISTQGATSAPEPPELPKPAASRASWVDRSAASAAPAAERGDSGSSHVRHPMASAEPPTQSAPRTGGTGAVKQNDRHRDQDEVRALIRNGMAAAALPIATRLVTSHPRSSGAREALADALAAMQRRPEAIQSYLQSATLALQGAQDTDRPQHKVGRVERALRAALQLIGPDGGNALREALVHAQRAQLAELEREILERLLAALPPGIPEATKNSWVERLRALHPASTVLERFQGLPEGTLSAPPPPIPATPPGPPPLPGGPRAAQPPPISATPQLPQQFSRLNLPLPKEPDAEREPPANIGAVATTFPCFYCSKPVPAGSQQCPACSRPQPRFLWRESRSGPETQIAPEQAAEKLLKAFGKSGAPGTNRDIAEAIRAQSSFKGLCIAAGAFTLFGFLAPGLGLIFLIIAFTLTGSAIKLAKGAEIAAGRAYFLRFLVIVGFFAQIVMCISGNR